MKPTLLVLAAGMGSRYGGVKQIDAVGRHGECLLDYATYDAMKSGFSRAVYIIRKDIEDDFRARLFDRVARNFDAEYVFQSKESLLTPEQRSASAGREKPWGTAHAVLCAREAVKSPFAVINSDDYYGRDAFSTMGAYLSSAAENCSAHAMVGYTLGNTMSKSGSVSRGVCTVKDGNLNSIEENLKIYYDADGKIVSDMDGTLVPLTGSEWVSMNFFGFGLNAFETFSEYWREFIAANAASPKAEALLPVAAGKIIREGGTVKFFTSKEKWFGMTYPEDRETVKKEIAAKIESGYYPEQLWGK